MLLRGNQQSSVQRMKLKNSNAHQPGLKAAYGIVVEKLKSLNLRVSNDKEELVAAYNNRRDFVESFELAIEIVHNRKVIFIMERAKHACDKLKDKEYFCFDVQRTH